MTTKFQMAHITIAILAICSRPVAAGMVYGWGNNDSGQIGNGNTTSASRVQAATSPLLNVNVQSIAAGANFGLALSNSGQIYSWGRNDLGQLGNGTVVYNGHNVTPTLIDAPAGVAFSAIAAGDVHSLGLSRTGQIYVWGLDFSGTNVSSAGYSGVPTPVVGLAGVTISAIAAGGGYSLGLSSTGKIYAWGSGGLGQLGSGNYGDSLIPTAVTGLSGVTITAISAGVQHDLALSSTGEVYSWGYGASGRLGTGGTTNSLTPTLVSGFGGNTIVAVSAGYSHSLALDSQGKVWAWGSDSQGQLGDGNFGSGVKTPIQLSGLSHIVSISAGLNDSFALASDGTLYAWGSNSSGQLGLGQNFDNPTPTAISGFHFTSVSATSEGSLTLALSSPPSVPEPSSLLPALLGLPVFAIFMRPRRAG